MERSIRHTGGEPAWLLPGAGSLTAAGRRRAPSVRIRRPLSTRVYLTALAAALSIAFVPLVITTVVLSTIATAVFTGVYTVSLMLWYRLVRAGVTASGDTLLVRNHYRTRRLARADIEAFRSGAFPNRPFGDGVFALLRDGSVVALDSTFRPVARPRARHPDRRLSALRAWLGEGGGEPPDGAA